MIADARIAWRDVRKPTLEQMGYTDCSHPYHRITPSGGYDFEQRRFFPLREYRRCALCNAERNDDATWSKPILFSGIDWALIDRFCIRSTV